MKKAFVSWSGGKDCCLAAYYAGLQGYELSYLINTVTQDMQRSCSHGMNSAWIKLQSEAMGIPIIQSATTGENYQQVYVDTIKKIKPEGVETGIFGDIDFNPHREWIEQTCNMAGVEPVLPHWNKDHMQLARDFIAKGFTSIVIATRADLLGEEWLGRKFDESFLSDISAFNKDISACGEAGEFHSLVIDGPLFKKSLKIVEAEKVRRNDHWYYDIKRCELVSK